jgi:tRNA G18 (ribose-2'-O)-methylase SpoU
MQFAESRHFVPTIFADAGDDRLRIFRDLKRSNETRDRRLFILEGDKLLKRVLEVGWRLHSAVVSDRLLARFRDAVPPSADLFVLSHQDVERLVGFNFHRGILAAAERPPRLSAEELFAGQGRRFVACNEIRDPTNLGAIVRSAAAFGWDGLIVGPSTPDPFSRRVLRTSMGAVLRLPVAYAETQPETPVEWQRRFGVASVAAVLAADSVPFDAWTPAERLALWLGNEDDGLPADMSAACTVRLKIPIAHLVDSLNVAVAAGILLQRLGPTDAALK